MSTTLVIPALIAFVAIAVAGFTVLICLRRSRPHPPQRRYGLSADTRFTVGHFHSKQPEAGLDTQRETAEDFPLPQFSSAEHARYAEVHAQYAESPGGAITEADQGPSDVLSMSACLVSDFEQCGADIIVRSPALTRDRVIHEIALRRKSGRAGADEVRQALTRYLALVESQPSHRRPAA